ncbi:arylformamidase [Batrachochytrium dendrobatidis]|nr:arylformamidase [Batrachochytrium dendrobatidis]KAK5667656.1 arylformamidase [Batrachochytrium dendrobatidis]
MTTARISSKAAHRLSSLNPGGTVFAEFTALANKHKAINLGQGFPTLPVADFITQEAAKAISTQGILHQYTRSEGHPKLVQELALFYSSKLGRQIDPLTEIVTTVGATEAIYSTIQAFVDVGDEVILMQPFYDSYPASILLAGGKPIVVSLSATPGKRGRASDWTLDMDELRKAITPKTKMIMINNPHNPLGKVFTKKELEAVATIAREFDLLIVADEVYETLTFSDSCSPFIKFASLPGMFERTITLGSIGKAFGVTGWKIGWAIAPPALSRAVWLVHQFIPFSIATPLQASVAESLKIAQQTSYFQDTCRQYESLRDLLYEGLESIGFNPMKPDGGYFIVADVSKIQKELNIQGDFSKFLTTEVGVTGIPVSAFYQSQDQSKVSHLVRFAFCKDRATIETALERLYKYFKK